MPTKQLTLRLPKRTKKSRETDGLAPGFTVLYRNKPMRVIRAGIVFGQLHVWIVDKDAVRIDLDDTLRVPANQVSLD